jgi:hypothetical protein
LISMGNVLTANRTVDTDPASIAMADMEDDATKQAPRHASGQLPILEKHLMGEFPHEGSQYRRPAVLIRLLRRSGG